MSITLGARSLARLEGVDPRLDRVVRRAAAIADPADDFTVLEGVRSRETMWEYWGKGRTPDACKARGVPVKYAQPALAKVTWLSDPLMSNHRMQPGGGKAVDLAPYPIDWKNTAQFDRLNALMEKAAALEGVDIRWGADWDQDGRPRERGESDSPHWELVA